MSSSTRYSKGELSMLFQIYQHPLAVDSPFLVAFEIQVDTSKGLQDLLLSMFLEVVLRYCF